MDRLSDLSPIEWTPLRHALARLMSDLSEECWCAGWLHDTEYALWALLDGSSTSKVWSASDDELEELQELAELSGAWIVWPSEWGEKEPVDLQAWKDHFTERTSWSDKRG